MIAHHMDNMIHLLTAEVQYVPGTVIGHHSLFPELPPLFGRGSLMLATERSKGVDISGDLALFKY
jgi:hypothetical protein